MQWNELPWTPRGLKFKHTVEFIGALIALTVVAGISGMWQ